MRLYKGYRSPWHIVVVSIRASSFAGARFDRNMMYNTMLYMAYEAKKKSQLTCLYTNADQFPNKKTELMYRLGNMSEPPDIIAITEMKPKNSRYQLLPTEYAIDGYTAHPALSGEHSRGIVVWTSNSMSTCEIKFADGLEEFQESIWLDITLGKGEHMLFGCIYRSPNSGEENNRLLGHVMKRASESSFSHMLITGDFNLRSINWENYSVDNSDPDANIAREFLERCSDAFLEQHVMFTTRSRHGQRASGLDLIFTKDENSVTDIQMLSPLGASDHCCLLFKYACTSKPTPLTKLIPIFRRADLEGANNYFNSIAWSEEMRGKSTQEMYDIFCSHYTHACDTFVPKMSFSTNQRRRIPGLPGNITEIIKKKHRAWTRYMEDRSDDRYRTYTKLRNKVSALTRKHRKELEKSIAKEAKENPKKFWNYVKSQRKTKERIPDLVMDENSRQKSTNDTQKAETLSQFFASSFTAEPPGQLPTPGLASL